jgi:murein DD-endopeptidase MepM/ murein hydrolase activator NlpD
MLSLTEEIRLYKFRPDKWLKIIWNHSYRDFRLYFEQDDELHYFIIKSSTQKTIARFLIFFVSLLLTLLLALSIHSTYITYLYKNVEHEKLAAEKQREDAIEALKVLSGDNVQKESMSQDDLLKLAKDYQLRMKKLEKMIQFSSLELQRANRSLESGLRAAGMNPNDLKRLQSKMESNPLASGGPDNPIEVSSAASSFLNDYQSKLAANESLHRVISAFPQKSPVRFSITSSKYGVRIHPITKKLSFHEGDDFIPTIDYSAYATMTGYVNSIEKSREGYGNSVIISNEHGMKTLYGHLDKIYVKPNQRIKPGDKVGKIGNTGFSTGRHLHYEIIYNETKLNPSIITAMAQNVY